MIVEVLLCLLASPTHATSPLTGSVVARQDDADVDQAINAAGEDVGKLMALAEQYTKAKNSSAAKKVYRRVIEIEPEHAQAREALRHQKFDGQWFESFVALAKYKREQTKRMEAEGLGLVGEEWVPLADVPYRQMGWSRDASGAWMDPAVVAEAKQVEEWKAAGYQFRADDNSWVAPEDLENWTNQLWKCGDEWLDFDKANAFHATTETCWNLAGEHFITWTSANWNTGNFARWHADRTYPHLVRIFGVEPAQPPHYFVHPTLIAYNDAAGGTVKLPESEGFSSFHGAYYSDLCFDFEAEHPGYFGMGVCYWDRSKPALDSWGPYWVRWAAAQSYIDAIDRSWGCLGQTISEKAMGEIGAFAKRFWTEKRIPRWLRYGAASYAERFLPNPEAAEGADPWDLRAFAFSEVKKGGGLRPLEQVFAFGLAVEDIPGSTNLYHEVGVVVSYMLDATDADASLHDAHEAFRTALASGTNEDIAKTAKVLEASLLVHEKRIRAFAGL